MVQAFVNIGVDETLVLNEFTLLAKRFFLQSQFNFWMSVNINDFLSSICRVYFWEQKFVHTLVLQIMWIWFINAKVENLDLVFNVIEVYEFLKKQNYVLGCFEREAKRDRNSA